MTNGDSDRTYDNVLFEIPEISYDTDISVCSIVTVKLMYLPKANDNSEETNFEILVTIYVLSNNTGDYDSPTTKKLADSRSDSVVKNPDNNYTDIDNAEHVGFDTL